MPYKNLPLLFCFLYSSFLSAQPVENPDRVDNLWYKGDIHLNLSFPFMNQIELPKYLNIEPIAGLGGVSVGADYSYTNKSYLCVQVGAITTMILVMDRVIDTARPKVPFDALSTFVNVKNNHNLGAQHIVNWKLLKYIDVGYGIGLSRNYLNDINYDSTTTQYTLDRFMFFGVTAPISVNFKMTHFVQAGILYQPQIINLGNSTKFGYNYTVSLDVRFTFLMNKR